MSTPDGSADVGYMRAVERLAHDVVQEAAREGWLAFDSAREINSSPLQRSINALARSLRMIHSDGDGCLGHD
jgi:hypothetical protein